MLTLTRARALTQRFNSLPKSTRSDRSQFRSTRPSSLRSVTYFARNSSTTSRSTFSWLNALPVLGVVAATVAVTSDDTETPSATEPRTGLKVPTQIQGHALVGTSARSVTFLRFLTYAFALYRSEEKWKNLTNEQVLQALVEDPTDSTFRIVTYRDIDCTHFCSSISAGTVPRMKKILEAEGVDPIKANEEADKLATEFRALFTSKDLPATTAVDFRIEKLTPASKNMRVSVYVNDAKQGHIENNLFTTALVGIYFGADPKSQEIQVGVQDSLNKRKV